MKTLRVFPIVALLMAAATISYGQKVKSESFKVSGNCGMCKSKIEKAAKEAGAKDASWDAETKELTVKYNSSSTNAAKIQEKIAEVGYDNAGFKATVDSYNKLHGCCKYDRTADVKADCCKDGKCTMAGHDGKDCCKDGNSMDCCKDGKCTMAGHDGKDCCKDGKKMDCCKDGKCTKEGHNGKDCCKASH